MQPWYQDSELGRDRSAILEMPLEDALQSPSSRFILTHAGSVLVKRPRHGRNTTLKDDRFSVAGLFLPFDRLPPGASDDEDAVVAWLGSKSGMDFWVLDLPAGGGSSAHPYSVESLLALRRAKKDDDDGWEAAPLRQFGDRMESAEDAAVYATANGLVAFHRSHPFCSRCGRRTVSAKAGACRRCEGGSDCPSAPSTVYPRIDAATIMLITSPSSLDGGEHCLLGRKKNWPKGRWSTLAGFVEVGETLEQCVGREVLEESGVAVDLDSVAFVASQPWPFPRSLMVGFQAEAKAVGGVTSNAEEEEEEEEEGEGEHGSGVLPSIAYDPNEMEDVRWFKRDFVAARLDGGSTALDFTPTAREAEFHLPGRASLARVLITQWALATPEGCGAAAAAVAAEREGGAGGDADANDEEEEEKAEEKEARRQQRGRKFKRKKPLVFVAHRGARTEAPENTLRALRRAFYARGAGGCEFDLRRTVDGELVLLHDDTLRRTARKPPGGGGAEEVGSGGGSKPLPSSIFYQSLEEYNAILDAPVEELTFAEVDAVRVGPDDDDTPALLSEALEVLLEVTTAAQRKKAKEKAEKGAAEDEDGEEAAKTREKDEELLPFFLAELKGGDLRSVALAADVLQEEGGFFALVGGEDDDDGGGGGGGKAARAAAAAAAAAAPLGALRPEQVRWIGFDLAVMEEAKRAMPRHAAYLIVEALDEGAALAAVADAASAGLDGVDFLALPHVVTAAVVDAARAAGLVVAAWESCNHPSTDTAATWEALDRNGVELFTSSMPSTLDEWRARIGV